MSTNMYTLVNHYNLKKKKKLKQLRREKKNYKK